MTHCIRRHAVATTTALIMADILSSGCTLDAGDSDPGAPRYQVDDVHCPPEQCGVNGVRLAESFFGPLRLDGAPNERSFAVVDLLDRNGRSYSLDVEHGALVGLERETGARALEDRELAGSSMVVASSDGAEWALTIESVDWLESWATGGRPIPGYMMSVAPWDARSASEADAATPEGTPMCADGARVVLFAGDETYDPATLDIQVHQGERHFTMACTDDLLGKVVRMGLDPERDAARPQHSTRETRSAALRMLRADYCGTGTTFTRPGTALAWQNQARSMKFGWPTSAAAAEAAWDESGAICLNQPRLDDRYSRSDVVAACGREIPRCDDELLASAQWVSFRP